MELFTQDKTGHRRATKIVATLGPASTSPENLEALLQYGVNVFRVNFSHGQAAEHKKTIGNIRDLESRYGRPIAILADLQGPKLRIGTFMGGAVTLKKGQSFRFDLNAEPGDPTRVCLPHKEVHQILNTGDKIYLDDGRVRLQVTAKGDGFLDTQVLDGDTLSDRKGFNLPGLKLPIPALTDKDKADLKTALEAGCDWIGMSFVQTVEDVEEAKSLIDGRARLMAKIEKPAALENFEGILDVCDGIMLARGDLGVEIPAEDVPSVQKRIVTLCRQYAKPIIVATQMLESMVSSPIPTRAEASDVSTAIYDGADAVMLSAETAVGSYPLEAVSMMDKIAHRVEQDRIYRQMIDNAPIQAREGDAGDALMIAAEQVAQDINADAIVTYTTSGSTALRIARLRPSMPILCLTQNLDTARYLCLAYGVMAAHLPDDIGFEDVVEKARKIALEKELTKPGGKLVISAGVPFGTPGTTNTLRIESMD